MASNIPHSHFPSHSFPQNMALPNGHFPPLYSDNAYPSASPYGDMDQDMYASQILAWSLEPRKQPPQHIVSAPQQHQQQPQLSIQTQFHDMERFKCGSYYSSPQTAHKISTPSSPSLVSNHEMYSVYHPPRVPSDDWRAVPEPASYHSSPQSYVTPHHQPPPPPHVHVKREEPQYAFPPLVDNYPQPSYPQQHIHSYEQLSAESHDVFVQNLKGFHPYPISPPASESSITSQQGLNLACNPRYVSQTQDTVLGSAEQQQQHGMGNEVTMMEDPSIDMVDEQQGGGDADAEGDLEGVEVEYGENHVEYLSSPSSEQEEEDDDPDYDPKDPDFICHQPVTRRRRSSVPIRQSHRFSPYEVSPVPQGVFEGKMDQRRRRRPTVSTSNISEGSSGSSSSYLPLTPTSPTDSADTLKSKSTPSLPLPVPVPNLTKKSRGRRVPTVTNLEFGKGPVSTDCGLDNGEFGHDGNPTSALASTAGITGGRRGAAKGVRMFTCKIPGCGKCFARGEHLKRHVRSIHTYEKPHKCPHVGCEKQFSRHDNLNQHTRVHRRDASSSSRPQ